MSTEILGLDEILGEEEDYDTLLGAAAPARRVPAGSSPVSLRKSEPTRGRQLVLGFDSVATVAAAATANVNSTPQQVFRPERVSIPATIAPNFLLNSLTIGTTNQFLNATGVHAETFSAGAQDVRLKMDTAQINSVISFSVTNLSLAAVRFFASLLGAAVM